MVPFLLAVFIATLAATPVFWLTRNKVPTALAIAAVVALLIVIVVGVGAFVAQSAQAFTAELPFYQSRLVALTDRMLRLLDPLGLEVSADLLRATLDPSLALQMAATTLRGFGAALSNGFLILLTVVFILAEASSFPRKLRAILANPDAGLGHFERFTENVNRYIAIKTTLSLFTGVAVAVFLTIVGVDFPTLWGLLAFLLNYVPTIGSIIAAVPAVLLALIQLGPVPAAVTAGGYLAINIVVGQFIEPRFMGRGLGISTLVVFLSLVFWGWVLGPVGMLLSVPLTTTVKIALEANPATEWMAVLLGPAEPVEATPIADAGPETPAEDA